MIPQGRSLTLKLRRIFHGGIPLCSVRTTCCFGFLSFCSQPLDVLLLFLDKLSSVLSFDWTEIKKGIDEKLDILPDKYEKRDEDQSKEFETALTAFARKLVLADPFEVDAAREILNSQTEMLLALKDIIDERLAGAALMKNKPVVKEDRYCWRYVLRGTEVPNGIEEWAEHFYHNLEYDKARAIFELLVKSFDNYAEGYNCHFGR